MDEEHFAVLEEHDAVVREHEAEELECHAEQAEVMALEDALQVQQLNAYAEVKQHEATEEEARMEALERAAAEEQLVAVRAEMQAAAEEHRDEMQRAFEKEAKVPPPSPPPACRGRAGGLLARRQPASPLSASQPAHLLYAIRNVCATSKTTIQPVVV